MSLETENSPLLADPTSAADALTALIKLVTDPKRAKANLDAITAGRTRLKDERDAAAREAKARAAALDEREREIAKREVALDTYEQSLTDRENKIEHKSEIIFSALHKVQRLDEQMRYAVMNYGGILSQFNDRLQALPTWESLNREFLDIKDAHLSQDDPSGQFARAEPTLGTELPENLVAGSMLRRASQSTAADRKSMRRLDNN